ncbi:hypothetical protein B0T17DRAFT_480536 [Bombardia bombarda]|uniref:Uncharacterized protein n=1 Tax=Bombardia bombarda TaxID=252184 RepID=A0AA39XN34_9PEZI|nr:hypothetical protein B0T17DRAFT_480536 [Bombardia bombarda]
MPEDTVPDTSPKPATGLNKKAGPKSTGATVSPTMSGATAAHGWDRAKVFDAAGPIGKQFTEEGAVGGTAQKIGGPLDKEGVIGKQFTEHGSIGGTVQNLMGGTSKRSN